MQRLDPETTDMSSRTMTKLLATPTFFRTSSMSTTSACHQPATFMKVCIALGRAPLMTPHTGSTTSLCVPACLRTANIPRSYMTLTWVIKGIMMRLLFRCIGEPHIQGGTHRTSEVFGLSDHRSTGLRYRPHCSSILTCLGTLTSRPRSRT